MNENRILQDMKTSDVIDLLKSNQNEKGIQKWNEIYSQEDALGSFGIGLSVLRKLAKQIGRNRALAIELWKTDLYDAKVISLLIDDPKQITREQAELQVEHVKVGYLAHVFSSCNASLAKTDFVVDLACDWVVSKDTVRRSCGYGLLYEISKSKKKNAPDDAFFLERIKYISKTFSSEKSIVKLSMGGALIGIGKRNAILNAAALKLAKKIGPIQFGSDKKKCEPLNVVKHLTSDYIMEKLGV